jgi:hypothetical protein
MDEGRVVRQELQSDYQRADEPLSDRQGYTTRYSATEYMDERREVRQELQSDSQLAELGAIPRKV